MNVGSLVGSVSTGAIIGSLVFSGVGFVAFSYGKKTHNFRLLAMGGVLMIFPYFVGDTTLMWLVGAVLSGSLYFLWE